MLKKPSIIITLFICNMAFADSYQSSTDVSYQSTLNKQGAILRSKSEVIYLSYSCTAQSTAHANGVWSWANGGFIISFNDKSIGFPHQEPPIQASKCRM
jgi:hypothetical protein